MTTTQFSFDCMDFEIAPGVWVEQVLEGTVTVSCHANMVDDWWLDEIEIAVVGPRPFVLKQGSNHPELFARLERALRRYDEANGRASEELLEQYHGDREHACQLWSEYA